VTAKPRAPRQQDLHRNLVRLVFSFTGALIFLCSALAHAAPLLAALDHESAIGLSARFLQENGERLTLPDAMAAYQAG
jgi:hypothetical protein